ncbi:ATPase PAAT [Tachyglossus aculeatus]|uniref:ATPase PAAT n=1 Tax=Tachyglossus aculeatus TaxID=9261 RepID=UPI0018F3EB7B|nr:ATPase PAAT [Tachyglossus aculeatus]
MKQPRNSLRVELKKPKAERQHRRPRASTRCNTVVSGTISGSSLSQIATWSESGRLRNPSLRAPEVGAAGAGRPGRERVPRGERFRAAGMERAGRLAVGASWTAGAPGPGLARALRPLSAGGGRGAGGRRDTAAEEEEEEEEGPAAAGEGLVTLKRNTTGEGESPCFLYLRCEPRGCEEMVSLGIVSEARNMEVYAGEEYRATGRGERLCTLPGDSGKDTITLYKKYLKLEDPTDFCKIKLLSFGGKQSLAIGKIQVRLRRVSANPPASPPTLGWRIDLDRVQAMMESMGTKLSPGAQQLMNMIRFQQRNCVPLGEQLQSVLGKKEPDPFGDTQTRDGFQHRSSVMGDSDKISVRHFPLKSTLTAGTVPEAFQTYFERDSQQFAGDCAERRETLPPNSVFPPNDFKVVSSLLQKKANANIPCSELLPFFQNICSQVNHLRRGDQTKPQETSPKPSKEGFVDGGDEQQPVCSYLEKIISKNMELMEKKLMDYIDQRMYRLQEHIDEKVILLMDLLRNPSFTSTRLTQGGYDSGERLSNGDR